MFKENDFKIFFFVDMQSYARTIVDLEYKSLFDSKNVLIYSDGNYVYNFLKRKGVKYYPGPRYFEDLIKKIDSIFILGPPNNSIEILKKIIKKN